MSAMQPKVTSSGGTFDVAALTDGDLAKATLLPAAPVNEQAWIQFEFPQPQTIRGLTFIASGGGGGRRRAAAARPARSSRRATTASSSARWRRFPAGARTIAFAPVTARFFRDLHPDPAAAAAPGAAAAAVRRFGGAPEAAAGRQAARRAGRDPDRRVRPAHRASVNRFQEKAAFSAATGIYAMATPAVPAAEAIRKADVIDLTSKMRPDGTLDWTPPAGNWVVLRIGYSLTGAAATARRRPRPRASRWTS